MNKLGKTAYFRKCLRGGELPNSGAIEGLKRPGDREGGSDGVESDIFLIRFGKAAIGDVLVKDTEIDGELIHDWDSHACSDREAEAEVLAL